MCEFLLVNCSILMLGKHVGNEIKMCIDGWFSPVFEVTYLFSLVLLNIIYAPYFAKCSGSKLPYLFWWWIPTCISLYFFHWLHLKFVICYVYRACYGVLRFVMESGAKGCEVFFPLFFFSSLFFPVSSLHFLIFLNNLYESCFRAGYCERKAQGTACKVDEV